MACTNRGKNDDRLIPDYLFVEGKLLHWKEIKSEMRLEAWKHVKHIGSVANRPLYYRFIRECDACVMNYGSGYTADEWIDICKLASDNKFVVQPILRDARGGGRGASGWGFAWFARENLIYKYLAEMGILEEFKGLPYAKQVTRIGKLFSEQQMFKRKPRVVLADDSEYEGLIYATPSFMAECNIPFGAKTTNVTKGLLVPLPYDNSKYDIVVPANENKLKISAEKLSDLMVMNPTLTPQKSFSRNLIRKFSGKVGKNPQEGLDLSSILGRKPKKEWLEDCYKVYMEQTTPQETADLLFAYENTILGEKVHNTFGKRVLAGESIFHPEIWPEANKALFTAAKKALQPRIKGIYGTLMPKELLRDYKLTGELMTGWFTRFPWTMPMKTEVEIHEHCIFVDNDLQKVFGGDHDGDQGAVFDEHIIKGHLDWNKQKEWIKLNMALPDKVESTEPFKDLNDSIAVQLDQYSGCGKTFNSSKIAIDNKRYHGATVMELIETEMKLQSKEVQPFIDGLKYQHASEMKKAEELVAQYYCGPVKTVPHIRKYFSPLRTKAGELTALLEAARDADPASKSFYEGACALFKDWPLKMPLNKKLAEFKNHLEESNEVYLKKTYRTFVDFMGMAEDTTAIMDKDYIISKLVLFKSQLKD